MLKKSNNILAIILFVFLISGVFFTLGSGNEAWGQDCNFRVVNVTIGGNQEFEFIIGPSQFSIFLSGGQSELFGISPDITVTEIVPEGWELQDIQCTSDGVAITEIENGVAGECLASGSGDAECRFINVRPFDIPTLSEWGLIVMAGILGITGFMVAKKRKVSA